MKKKLHTLALLFLVTIAYPQAPAGYYNTAISTGYDLKTQLFNIIKNHQVVSYSGLWNLYNTTDVRPNGQVWDIYTTCPFIFGSVANGGNQDNGTGGTAECQFYNKEHTFPKSWFNNTTSPMYSDAFHVMPADKKVNNLRGNLAYGLVGTPTYTSSNGTKIGNCVAPNYPYTAQVIEPADELKGDIARNYFYMATCYQDLIGSWQTNSADANTVLDGTNDHVFEQWYLDMLYTWHINDPVSAKEIARNNAVYAAQINRNPFIDHPEWVFTIWGSTLKTTEFERTAGITIYPNPSNNHQITVSSKVPLEEITILTLNGQVVQQISKQALNSTSNTIDNIPQGFYFIRLSANDQTIIKKVVVN